ncbi:hypothetical protein [Robertkochia aurantiaca]|uniref:hypothetical protein n=1 Tax=Robertkochia aurantiaca TaxID=2873700 RepID=UPI001CCBDE69|nr:hypothetical protein [Robertkochia sp. 3YJGBD-33]
MKHILHFIFGGITIFTFAQCGSSQVFVTEPPFTHGEVAQEPWTAGEDRSLSGTNVLIPMKDEGGVELDSLHYRGKRVPLHRMEKGSYVVYIGRLYDETKPDLIMHADPRKEGGNRPPRLIPRSDLDLDEGEAAVSYSMNGERYYYRLTDLTPSPPVHYNQKPPF